MEQTFKALHGKEFLLTNGIGGYCSSTFSGANTRRYHGLLVAAFNPPTSRMVLLSKIEEQVNVDGKEYELSANQYPGTIHPQGFQYLTDHRVDNNRAFLRYTHPDFSLEKQLSMVQGANCTQIAYRNNGSTAIDLQLRPMLVYKDYHSLFQQTEAFDFHTEQVDENNFKVYAQYQSEPLFIKTSAGTWDGHRTWYNNFELAAEADRGFPCHEDAMHIGTLSVALAPGESIQLQFSTREVMDNDIAQTQCKGNCSRERSLPPFVQDLEASSRQFVVERKSTGGSTIIAGYHWFTDWGRDTMIAMRGISMSTLLQQESKSILHTFFRYLDKGMLPNRFPDKEDEALEYNTIDATLWLFVALYEYQETFHDLDFIASVLPQLHNIIEEHVNGTRFNIHVTPEGLLYGGEEGYQLTWMDARVDGFVVTPRIGCPVEINLLWYNGLQIYQYFTTMIGNQKDESISVWIEKFEQSFVPHFFNESGYLNDVVIPNVLYDNNIRPNQIYAISLPFSPLGKDQQSSVLQVVEKELYTDYGLRTLSVDHPDFKPLYHGNSWDRDNAYHQGTVWPFLWGEWALAHLSVHGWNAQTCLQIWKASQPLQQHFYREGCLHGIAEIFDGLDPKEGKGCVQQAWSVGMLLKVFLDPRFDYRLIHFDA